MCEWVGLKVVYTIIKKKTQCQNKCIIVIMVANQANLQYEIYDNFKAP